jgi:plastocyanin
VVQITFSSLEYEFKPKGLTVHPGAWVTWVNRTADEHSVTMDVRGLLPVIVPPHGRVTLVFPTSGRYPYHCSFHPYQRGQVIVSR